MQAQAIARRQTALGGNTDTGWLKIVALVFMIIDHLGVAMFPGVTEMRILGRIAMPIYAWCLVVGCEYTHDIYRYALRLLALAVISQPINMVALSNTWGKLNILFLLCLGVLVIAGIREKKYLSQFWAPLLAYALLCVVNMDYGWKGLTFILMLYAARNSRGGVAAVLIAFSLFWGGYTSQVTAIAGVELSFLEWPGIGVIVTPLFRLQALMWLALPFIVFPSHMKLKMPKWLGYGVYPLHLLVIILLLLLTGKSLGNMLAVLVP
jgi:hypothetical protein